MKRSKSLYHGRRFPAEVISCAVRWYFRFQLSLRDIEELLFESGYICFSDALLARNDSSPAAAPANSTTPNKAIITVRQTRIERFFSIVSSLLIAPRRSASPWVHLIRTVAF
jgi:hypothetical protein